MVWPVVPSPGKVTLMCTVNLAGLLSSSVKYTGAAWGTEVDVVHLSMQRPMHCVISLRSLFTCGVQQVTNKLYAGWNPLYTRRPLLLEVSMWCTSACSGQVPCLAVLQQTDWTHLSVQAHWVTHLIAHGLQLGVRLYR